MSAEKKDQYNRKGFLHHKEDFYFRKEFLQKKRGKINKKN